jgi:hypothetical protein
MMLLATIVILSGSLARTPYVGNLAVLAPPTWYGPPLLFGALLFLLHWGMTRLVNRWFLIGYAGIGRRASCRWASAAPRCGIR